MCGRYSLYQSMDHYLRQLGLELAGINGYDHAPVNRFNVAPSTRVELIRTTAQELRIDKVRWGWAPHWAQGNRPASINARVETVADSRFFRPLWPGGRAVAPADGWFEWVKDPQASGKKQPYFIKLKSDEPMFFATLAHVHIDLEPHPGDGFVIITDASEAGMLDIHDRRPVVLAPDEARQWLNPDLSAGQALELAHHSRPIEDFEWYPVGQEVGNPKNQGPGLIDPVQPD